MTISGSRSAVFTVLNQRIESERLADRSTHTNQHDRNAHIYTQRNKHAARTCRLSWRQSKQTHRGGAHTGPISF